MRIKSYTRLLCLLTVSIAIAACGHSNGSGKGGKKTLEFSAFVTDLIQNQTSDTAEPVAVNNRKLNFSDDEGQFDELLDN